MALRSAAVVVAAVAIVTIGASSSRARQSPVFSARVDTVRVDVSVRRGGAPVRGLSASDFDVFDNGVRQHVDLVADAEAPLEVVLALDVSGSVQGATLSALSSAGTRLVGELRPPDRAALVTFASHVTVRARPTSDLDAVRRAFAFAPESGSTALADAVHAALVLAGTGTGRPIVIVFSDGADTASFLAPEAVLAGARRIGAVVYAVTTREARGTSFLDDLTKATGGDRLEIDTAAGLTETFARILEDVRYRYLLSFTPEQVTGDGWHELTVRTRNRRDDVRARAGYWAGQS